MPKRDKDLDYGQAYVIYDKGVRVSNLLFNQLKKAEQYCEKSPKNLYPVKIQWERVQDYKHPIEKGIEVPERNRYWMLYHIPSDKYLKFPSRHFISHFGKRGKKYKIKPNTRMIPNQLRYYAPETALGYILKPVDYSEWQVVLFINNEVTHREPIGDSNEK